jgi:hypothetical protein
MCAQDQDRERSDPGREDQASDEVHPVSPVVWVLWARKICK